MPRQLVRRVGRRGASLLFLALLDLIYSASLLAIPASQRNTAAFLFLTAVAPLPVWAALWGIVGVQCAVQAFVRRDRLAFAAASLLKVAWGVLYLLGWLLVDIPRGYVSGVIWLALAAWIAIISGWPEPPRTR